jgi:hypothetical protein
VGGTLIRAAVGAWMLLGWWPGLAVALTWAVATPPVPCPPAWVLFTAPALTWLGGTVLLAALT